MDPIVALVIILIHLGVLVWAVANRHPWWAIGIFLFPIVGDIVYVIYYFSTQEPGPSPSTELWKEPTTPGETVRAIARTYNRQGFLAMRAGEEAVVVKVDRRGGGKRAFVTVVGPNGKQLSGLTSKVLRVVKPAPGEGPESAPSAPSLPGRGHTELRPQLEELARLREDGLITEEEFTAKKRKLLGID